IDPIQGWLTPYLAYSAMWAKRIRLQKRPKARKALEPDFLNSSATPNAQTEVMINAHIISLRCGGSGRKKKYCGKRESAEPVAINKRKLSDFFLESPRQRPVSPSPRATTRINAIDTSGA